MAKKRGIKDEGMKVKSKVSRRHCFYMDFINEVISLYRILGCYQGEKDHMEVCKCKTKQQNQRAVCSSQRMPTVTPIYI